MFSVWQNFVRNKGFFSVVFFVVFISLLIPISSALAVAGVPQIMSYQGRLANSAGDLVGGSGAIYSFKFSLWDSATVGGGNRVWPVATPTAFNATVRQGLFNVNIGDTANGYPDTLDYDFSLNNKIYLQIEVSSDGVTYETLGPRQPLTSTPFARVAASVYGSGVSTMGGLVVNGDSTTTNATTTGAGYFGSAIGLAGQYINQWSDLSAYLPTVTGWGTTSDAVNWDILFASSTSDGLAEGSVNKYYSDLKVSSYLDLKDKSYFFSSSSADIWGASKGYLTSYTETDPLYAAASSSLLRYGTTSDALTEGLVNKFYTQAKVWTDIAASSTLTTLFANAATAFSWGNHALAGYLTNALFDTRLAATTSLPNLATLSGLSTAGSSTGQMTILGKTVMTNASTSNLSVSGNAYLSGLADTFLSVNSLGQIVSTTTSGGGDVYLANNNNFTGLNTFENATTTFGSGTDTFIVSNITALGGAFTGKELSGTTNIGANIFSIKNGLYLRGEDGNPSLTFGTADFSTTSAITYNASTDQIDFENSEITTPTGNSIDWTQAFNWGNHALAGYLTSYTESDPVWLAASTSYAKLSLPNVFTATNTFSTDISITGLTGNIITSTNVKQAIQDLDARLYNQQNATQEITGFPNRTDTSIAFDSGTRNFTITGTNFKVYSAGKEYIKNTESIGIPNTVGLYFVYYHPTTHNLATSTTAWGFADGTIQIATVYWDGTTGVVGEERHGLTMDNATHEYLHHTVGTRYQSGLAGTFNTNNTFSITAGSIDDEDIENSIGLSTTARIFYHATASTFTYSAPGTSFFDKTCTGSNLCYDNGTGKVAATGNNYVAYWVFATNDPVTPIYVLMGQRQDTTLANAQANQTYGSLTLGTLPFAEMKLLYRVIVRNNAGNTLSTDDYRSVSNLPSGTYVATLHSSLTGLTSDDHTQYALLAGRVGGQSFFGGNAAGENLSLFGNSIDYGNIYAQTYGGSFTIGTTSAITLASTLFNVASTTGDNYFTILKNGNIGIGTSTPSNKLEVNGNSFFSGILTALTGAFTNLSSSNSTTTNLALSNLANSYLSVNGLGQVIATTTPVITESDPVWLSEKGDYITSTQASEALAGYLSLSDWNATTTDALAEGLNNKYYTQAKVWDDIVASSTFQTFSNYWTKLGNDLNYLAGNVAVGTSTFDGTNPEKFLIDAGDTSSVNGLVVKGNINNYFQMNIKNSSAGANASADIVATNDTGTESTGFINMGINSSGYSGGVVGLANDTYLYGSSTGNMLVGNASAGKNLIFFTNGANGYSNEKMRINSSGFVGIGNTNPTQALEVGTTTAGLNGIFNATLGAELAPTLDSGSWTGTNGWSATGSTLEKVTNATAGTMTPSGAEATPVIGTTYKITITTSAKGAAAVTYTYGGITGTTIVVGTFTDYITAATTGKLIITGAISSTATITGVSIKALSDNTGDLYVYGDLKLASRLTNPSGTLGLEISPTGAARLGSTLTTAGAITTSGSITAVGVAAGGAVSGVTTLAHSGIITGTVPTLYVSSDAHVLTAAASTGVTGTLIPLSLSPRIRQVGQAWDIDGAANVLNNYWSEVIVYPGNTVNSKLAWYYSQGAMATAAEYQAPEIMNYYNGSLSVLGSTYDSEVLTNGALTSGTSWTQANGFSLSSNTAVYLHNASGGTLTQASSTFSTPVKANRWYRFTWTSSAVNTTARAYIDPTGISQERVYLRGTVVTPGTYTTTFKTNSNPGNFIITADSAASGDGFTLDNLSLVEINSGNIVANGLFTGGGTEGLKIDNMGLVGIGTSTPDSELNIFGTNTNFLRVSSSTNQSIFVINSSGDIAASGNLTVSKNSTLATTSMAFGSLVGSVAQGYMSVEDYDLGTIPAGTDLGEGPIPSDVINRGPLIKFSSPNLGIDPTSRTGGVSNALMILEDDSLNSNPKLNFVANDFLKSLSFNIATIEYSTTSKNMFFTADHFGLNTETTHLLELNGGAYSDGPTWENSSDRNKKENFIPLDPTKILEKINQLPITQWNYISQSATTTHIGPMAQDFYALFGLGGSDTSISTVDPAGVALVGIQALDKKIKVIEENLKMISAGGNLSIGTDGTLVFKSIKAETAEFDMATINTGVTVKDADTGDYQCIYVASGQIRTKAGACGPGASSTPVVSAPVSGGESVSESTSTLETVPTEITSEPTPVPEVIPEVPLGVEPAPVSDPAPAETPVVSAPVDTPAPSEGN